MIIIIIIITITIIIKTLSCKVKCYLHHNIK